LSLSNLGQKSGEFFSQKIAQNNKSENSKNLEKEG
jgi:hypothetical protein